MAKRTMGRTMLAIVARDGINCHYCDRPTTTRMKDWLSRTVDHKMPRSRGGTNSLDNLVIACRGCNTIKASMTYEEFQRYLHYYGQGYSRASAKRLSRIQPEASDFVMARLLDAQTPNSG